jgi:hypothetical protein
LYVFVNSIEKDVMCKFQVELWIIFNYTNWTNQMKWVICAFETWVLHEITRLITTQTWEKSSLAYLPPYIYIWHRCLWNYIKMTKMCKFWNWTFWFCHIVIFATLKTHNFFYMIYKFNNIIYNAWKRLFNVTSIFLIKLNLISQISITCNLIMYQQKKINLINDEYKRITHEIVCLNMSAMGKANSWGKSKASLKGKWKFMKNVGR